MNVSKTGSVRVARDAQVEVLQRTVPRVPRYPGGQGVPLLPCAAATGGVDANPQALRLCEVFSDKQIKIKETRVAPPNKNKSLTQKLKKCHIKLVNTCDSAPRK